MSSPQRVTDACRIALAALCLCGLGAPASAQAKEPAMAERCIATLQVTRGTSPWRGYTASAQEEQAGKSIQATPIVKTQKRLPHLSKYDLSGEPLLAIDEKARRVVVDARFFSDLQRADATRLAKGETRTLGRAKEPLLAAMKARDLVWFLLEAQLIETYWHLEATVCLEEEQDDPAAYRARFRGEHVYFTSKRNADEFRFEVQLDKKSGALSVAGA